MKLIASTILLLAFLAKEAHGFCSGVPDLTYIRSQNACYLYYSCINGIAYPQSCAEGLHFSMELQRCVSPDESDCDIEDGPQLPDAPAPEPSPVCSGVESYTYVMEPFSCQWYYHCIDGIAFKLSCPKDYIFSFEHQRCGNQYEYICDLVGY